MEMNWDDLRFFLTLCRTQSFVAAARVLKVTHSTVARRISALEARLETQLFLRTEKGCQMTDEGFALLPYAEKLERTVINFEAEVAGRDNRLSGCVRIGTPDGIGTHYLSPRLASFRKAHPTLEIELIPVPRYYSLSKREVDILITVKRPERGKVIARKLTRYKLGLFASKSYLAEAGPIETKEDLSGHPFVGYIDDLLFDRDLDFKVEFPLVGPPVFRTSTILAQMKAVEAGAGIGILPYFMAHTQENLMPVLPGQDAERGFWLQVNSDSRHIARVRKTIDFISGQIQMERDLFFSLPVR